MEKSLIDVLNKGVPISTPVTIRLKDLCDLTTDEEELMKRVDREFDKFMDYIDDKYKKNDIEYFKTLCIISDPITLEKRLHFNPNSFIFTLLFNLNVNKVCINPEESKINLSDFEQYVSAISQRISYLRQIMSENKLAKEFPALYKKYKIYQEYYRSFEEVQKFLDNPRVSNAKKLARIKYLVETYKKNGDNFNFEEMLKQSRNFSLKTFCNEYADTFENLLNNKDDIIEYLQTHSLSINRLGIEAEKLELYIAYMSLLKAEEVPKSEKQRYIYYVANYFNTDRSRRENTDLAINIGRIASDNIKVSKKFQNGKIITPKYLYELYKRLLINNPQIRIIDLSKVDFSGMTLVEVEEFMVEYLKDLQSNWEIIPPETILGGTAEISEREKRIMTPEEQELYKRHLEELYLEKQELYGSTDPFARVRGKNTFAGYIGHIYSNGKVILDKFFKSDKTQRLAYGEAIYIMDIADFYRLSQYPKSVLKTISSVQRIEHRNTSSVNWKEEVRKAIESGKHEYRTAEEVKQLIKAKKLEE